MNRFLTRTWGAFISRLYWRFGRPYDADAFWHRVVCYHIANAKVDGRYVVADLNRTSSPQITWRAEGVCEDGRVRGDEG